MQDDPIFKKSKVVVSRPVKPQTLVIPIKAGSANLNEVYMLNETAGRIWQLLDGQHTASEIIMLLTQEYDVTVEEAQADYEQLVSDLESLAVVEKVTL